MRKPVSTTLARQWRMVMRLRQRKWTVLVLALNFGVTKSTVERDLATMVEAGLPVRSEPVGGTRRGTKRWWMEEVQW